MGHNARWGSRVVDGKSGAKNWGKHSWCCHSRIQYCPHDEKPVDWVSVLMAGILCKVPADMVDGRSDNPSSISGQHFPPPNCCEFLCREDWSICGHMRGMINALCPSSANILRHMAKFKCFLMNLYGNTHIQWQTMSAFLIWSMLAPHCIIRFSHNFAFHFWEDSINLVNIITGHLFVDWLDSFD